MAQPKIKDGALAQTNLAAATLDGFSIGTGANGILQLNGSAQIPAVDGSLVTNVDAVTLGGQPVGTGANDIVALDASSRLPAVDGSLLTNLPGQAVGIDNPVPTSLTVQSVLSGAWTTVLVNANAKFALVSAYCYGIFDTGGGHVAVYARKAGLTGNAAQKWEIGRIGKSAASGANACEMSGGSVLVECNGSGQIELYAFTSAAGTIAELGEYTIKGWIE